MRNTNMTTNPICPCCQGTGRDLYFDLKQCLICGGGGRIEVEPLGDFDFLKYGTHTIPVEELLSDEQLGLDIFQWAKLEYANKTWWEVEELIPTMKALQEHLLKEGLITLADIPGGLNNPRSAEMKKMANDTKAKKPAYTSYKTRLKEKAAKAADLHIDIELTAPEEGNAIQSPDVETTPVEETPMNTMTDRLKNSGRTVIGAAQEGAAIGAVTATNKSVINFMAMKAGDAWPDFLNTPAGRQILELALPAIVLMATEMDEGNKIPGKEHVARAATYALKGTSAEAAEAVMALILEHGGMMMMAYAEAGKGLEAEAKTAVTSSEITSEQATINEAIDAERAKPVFETS